METIRKWHVTIKVMKAKHCQFKILYAAKTVFRNKNEIINFTDEGQLRAFVASRLALNKVV